MKEQERRDRGRVQFLRPILYVHPDSDKFIEATMLNHAPNGICFQTTPPVTPGSKIYILKGEPFPERLENRWADAIYAKVMWCEQRSGTHWVGVQYLNSAISYDLDETGVSGSSVPFEPSFHS